MRAVLRSAALLLFGAALFATPSAASAQKKSKDLITSEEIMKSSQKDQDLIKVIQALRPHMLEGPRGLRSLGGGAINPLIVVVDNIRQPGLDALLSIRPDEVKEIRYLDPNRSQNEYGVNGNGGAIVVKRIDGKKEK
jgi:hypothetical protein